MMQEDPSPTPPQFFLGREVDMYHVLGFVLTKRLVSVVGDTGCGRSSLVCALCHYINERSSTIMEVDRIFFVKTKQLRGGDRCRALIQSLLNKLVENGKAHQPQSNNMDTEDLFEVVCRALKPTKALIVFDRTELLEEDSDEAQDFPLFLSTLFRETRNVRVVLTGRQALGIPSIGGVVEQPYYLRGLNFANTVRLFASLSPHLHTDAERHKFFVRIITDAEQADLCHQDQSMSERTKKLFQQLGNGMPAQTEKVAYTIPREKVESMGMD
uniref:NACHT domain-containing protein n=1 Tax=Cyclophora tenuis TaxID=216820 RepID=A0A7S1CX06_CYCTE|eukprot:CAMPEP_0116541558 /NCGR_PEP_ID=MMETSP0397-20121206/548_1 /TAXON_ID=216820 /ORGANISM="Cyclophora tenuis, Strain ECT3854" /LENGTH=269 /DNA_ID=CAMNT_0004065511 /DNA_START=131 /DNA_END=940 /DNA_ORIENTATION=-